MTLYLIRHGTTLSNEKHQLLGKIDENLSKKGIDEINILKEKLKFKFDICFSSPYKRTMETAKILMDSNNIIIDDRLKERDFGLLEDTHNFKLYTEEYWDYNLNKNDYDVEAIRNLLKRTREFLIYLKENYADKNVLIVSHAATIRALHFNIIGYNANTNFLNFRVPNAQLYKYFLNND